MAAAAAEAWPASLRLDDLAAAYHKGLRPAALVRQLHARALADTHATWISLLPLERLLSMATALEGRDPSALPLYGVPFAVKDNIDVAGHPTTAGCAAFAYVPEEDAAVVALLMAAGALPLGKTNMDQFATGLNGTRSPYGPCTCAFDPHFIAGGSSSGSAVSVATGQVSFALGTDTAGSGRVPAAFNNVVGLKPTRGVLSARGVVPACRSLDAVSLFALTAADAERVFRVAAAFDPQEPFSRPLAPPPAPSWSPDGPFRLGVPLEADLAFFGDDANPALFRAAVTALESLGGVPERVPFAPFLRAARLLYEGPWVAERYLAVRRLVDERPDALLPVTRDILLRGKAYSAADAFEALHELQGLTRACEGAWARVDVIVTPTAGFHPTVNAVLENPVTLNTALGYYTNFMNLLDYSAIAVPAALRPGDGLPFGVTLFAPAHSDAALLRLAARLQRHLRLPLGATGVPFPFSDSAAG